MTNAEVAYQAKLWSLANESTKFKSIYPPVDTASLVGRSFPVLYTHVKSPSKFYVRLESWQEESDAITDRARHSVFHRALFAPSELCVGTPCLYRYIPDHGLSTYIRAEVSKVVPGEYVLLDLKDEGRSIKVRNLRLIHSAVRIAIPWRHWPPLCFKCRLADVPFGYKWSEEQREEFKKLVTDGDPAEVVSVDARGTVHLRIFDSGRRTLAARLLRRPFDPFKRIWLTLGRCAALYRTSGDDPDNFCVQSFWWAKLYAMMTFSIENPTPLEQLDSGTRCLFQRNQTWHRGAIMGPEEGNKFKVRSVDTGIELCLEQGELFSTDGQRAIVTQLPDCCLPAKLGDVKPNGSEWSDEEKKRFQSVFFQSSLTNSLNGNVWWSKFDCCKPERRDGKVFVLFDSTAAELMINSGHARRTCTKPEPQYLTSKRDLVRLEDEQLDDVHEGRARCVYMESPSLFWLKLHHWSMYQNGFLDPNTPKAVHENPKVGDICVVDCDRVENADGNVHCRAEVKEVDGANATVHLMDCGLTEQVAVDELLTIENQTEVFENSFGAALPCRLDGIIPPEGREWSLAALRRFYELAADTEELTVVFGNSKGNVHGVTLRGKDSEMSIGEQMVAENHARHTVSRLVRFFST